MNERDFDKMYEINFEGMDENEFARWFSTGWKNFLKENIELSIAGKLVQNPIQVQKCIEIATFFEKIGRDFHGRLEPVGISPVLRNGYLTASFTVLDLSGDELIAFIDVLSSSSAVSIDAKLDGRVEISVTVPNVFVEVEEQAE